MMEFRWRRIASALVAAMTLPAQAFAAPGVTTASTVYVERTSDGHVRSLEPASSLRRGDRVITVLTWRRTVPGGGFTLTNPLPGPLYYQSSADSEQDVSVDGGRSWGRLGSLRIGNRMATPEDVTHLRWRVATQGSSGRIAYSAIVR